MTWFKNCVLIDKLTRDADYDEDPIVRKIDNPKNSTFQIIDTKLNVPVVTLSKENNIKLLEKLKSGFKRTIKWNKYRSRMAIQNNNNNLNYLTDPTLQMLIDYLFYHFKELKKMTKKGYNDSFSHYYLPKIQIKDFNVLIDGKNFFDLQIKNEEEAYEKIIDMSNNNNYMAGNLLDFACYKENYELIAIDLSKQTEIKDPQEINFIGKIEEQNKEVIMFFIIEKSEETTFEFLQNSVNIL